ncbi:MAG: hypothetical protein HFI19_02445 [Lachnospiraceae bacterium]|jgi:uncharacterized protein (UPF0303 family)|uniref:heme-binding protein n=1 Tax=Candidatus Merdisoma sp. JLR.KK006 TaxID=3112626 RepID=UPI002FEF0B63|nr:hypothetical protein [Lachnospiraceae bacterium]
MGTFYWEEQWTDILAEQEQLLRYPEFTRKTALDLGMEILRLAREAYHKSAAIRIVEDGTTIFAYKMEGTSSENDWWMDKKLSVSRMTGMSSLRSYVEAESGRLCPEWEKRPNNFAACGGCFPIFHADNKTPWIHVLVSGMKHYEDHQIIADAMAIQLNKTIRRIL